MDDIACSEEHYTGLMYATETLTWIFFTDFKIHNWNKFTVSQSISKLDVSIITEGIFIQSIA